MEFAAAELEDEIWLGIAELIELLTTSVLGEELGALEIIVLEGIEELVVRIGVEVDGIAEVVAAEELTDVKEAAVVLADAPVPIGMF